MYYRGVITTPQLTLRVEVDKELRIFDSKGLIEFSDNIGNMCFYDDEERKVAVLFVMQEEDYYCLQLLYDHGSKMYFAWFSQELIKTVHCDVIAQCACYVDAQLVLNCTIDSDPLRWELAVLLCQEDINSFRSSICQQDGGYYYYYIKELAKKKQVNTLATLASMQGDIGQLQYR